MHMGGRATHGVDNRRTQEVSCPIQISRGLAVVDSDCAEMFSSFFAGTIRALKHRRRRAVLPN